MMRSLFSGVAGLRTHQTRMDVIGNNIANVNTVAYKSSSMTFQDLLYQTTSNASGANAATGRAGINAKQIGLGVSTGSIATSIATGGSNEQTGNPFDIKINGSSFFVVNDGSNQYYTRAGAFNVDAEGTLCMSSNGYNVMGYRTTENAMGDVVIDTSQLRTLDIMSERNQVNDPMMTERSYLTGIIDKNDDALETDKGKIVSFAFYDNLGYSYTAQFSIKPEKDSSGAVVDHQYNMVMTDIFNSEGKSILTKKSGDETVEMTETEKELILKNVMKDAKLTFNAATGNFTNVQSYNVTRTMDDSGNVTTTKEASGSPIEVNADTKRADLQLDLSALGKETSITYDAWEPKINATTGEPEKDTSGNIVYEKKSNTVTLSPYNETFATVRSNLRNYTGQLIDFDVANIKDIDNNGTSTANGGRGMLESTEGAGWKVGELSSISIGVDGRIMGAYTNGQTKLLGQIATASFANASGLEKAGDNLYGQTANSGEAIIGDITADGGSMNTGNLEMSNVDLSQEFTTMITTQRGFQANSRVITVSDTLLEELVNLKR